MMTKFDIPKMAKKKKLPLIIGGISAIGIATSLGFTNIQSSDDAEKQHVQSLEESLRLEGEVISFHAVRHSVHQGILAGLQSSIEVATTKVVKPELAEWTGQPVEISGSIEAGQSVYVALSSRNVDPGSIQSVVLATNELFNFRKQSKAGDNWSAKIDKNGKVVSFQYSTSPENIWITKLNEKGEYEVEKKLVPVDLRIRVATGQIESSLWKALADSSAGSEFVTDFIELFAYKVDFATETKPGDEFSLVYEEVFLDGEFLRFGNVLAAYYKTSEDEKEHFGFRFNHEEKMGYFDENGSSLKGQFLKTPLASAKVTSVFGRRFHPVLKKMKMHQGVDYAAPLGTPVQSIASGVVLHAGWKGANGKLVSIKHSNGYVTHYAHLSKIKAGLKRGSKVTQKTVIGEVGSTGRSTGNHLHLGMSKNGKYVNPLSVDFVKGDRIPTQTLEKYKKEVVLPMMKQLRNAIASDPDG